MEEEEEKEEGAEEEINECWGGRAPAQDHPWGLASWTVHYAAAAAVR